MNNLIKHGWLITDHFVSVYYFRETFPWNRAEMSLGAWLTLVESWCAVDVSWDERGLRLFSDCVVPHSSDSTLLDEQTMKQWSLSSGGQDRMFHLFFFFLICSAAPKIIWMPLDTSVVLIWCNDIHTFLTKYQSKWYLEANDSFYQN